MSVLLPASFTGTDDDLYMHWPFDSFASLRGYSGYSHQPSSEGTEGMFSGTHREEILSAPQVYTIKD